MSIPTSVAPLFQSQWALRMVDTCHIQRQTSTALNPTTGVETPTYSDVYGTSGTPAACLVRPASAADTQAGEQQQELRMYNVYIPYTVINATVGDQVTVTSTNDTMLNGLTFTVRNIPTDTYNHRRLLVCEESINEADIGN